VQRVLEAIEASAADDGRTLRIQAMED
jgi:hypothetical protein